MNFIATLSKIGRDLYGRLNSGPKLLSPASMFCRKTPRFINGKSIFGRKFTTPFLFGKTKTAGFTLIEILVVISISLVLTTLLILYGRASEAQLILFKDRAKLYSVIYRAKFLSIETYSDSGTYCGFGVNFSLPRTYLIFKEAAADCGNLAQSNRRYSISDPSDSVVEQYDLDSQISFDTLPITDIFFVPPDPKTVLTPAPPTGTATVVIKADNVGSSLNVKVNDMGQITL